MLKSNWPYHDTLCPAHHAIQDGECCCHVKRIEELEAANAVLLKSYELKSSMLAKCETREIALQRQVEGMFKRLLENASYDMNGNSLNWEAEAIMKALEASTREES